jgi:diaminopimelate decarboxylase
MHEFKYRDGRLFCEDIPVEDIITDHPTPFYLYSYKTIIDHYNKIKQAFSEVDPLICFSVKSNSNLNVCKALVGAGSGLDIVSGGELFRALKSGCDPSRIVYASVGKTEDEIEEALKKGILLFNVESVPELIMIDTVAKKLGRKADVALRINPDVKADTHQYITTGTKEKKFGISFKQADEIFDNANKYPHVNLKGVHLHIGSQITSVEPFVNALKKVLDFLDSSSIKIEYLNIGGGFGIAYEKKDDPSTARELADSLIPLLREKSYKLIIEPGRFIMGNSGILVCRVLYVKTGATGKKFAIVDAGMNDLLRPSLYEAYHEILPLSRRESRKKEYDVVGPICESGDYLALRRELQELIPGEYLAVMSSGAYGFAMSSNYNSRPRAAELMVMNGNVKVIRSPETYKDLIRGEKIIKELK